LYFIPSGFALTGDNYFFRLTTSILPVSS